MLTGCWHANTCQCKNTKIIAVCSVFSISFCKYEWHVREETKIGWVKIRQYSWPPGYIVQRLCEISPGTSGDISESLRKEFDDTYPVLSETFACRTICPFNRVVISTELRFLQQLLIDNKSDAGMLQRRTAEPDCSAVMAFSSAHPYIIFPTDEINPQCILCLIHPSDFFLKCLQLGRQIVQQLGPDAFFMASDYNEHLSVSVEMHLANLHESISKDTGIYHFNMG